MRFLVTDFETSDLPDFNGHPGMSKARIVQFACILLSEEFNEIGLFSSLIKLEDGVAISPGAQNSHGISLEECHEYGIPISSALDIFDSFASQADIVVAHNMRFESFLLATECVRSGREMYNLANGNGQAICTMLASTSVCGLTQKGSNRPKWPRLEEAYEILVGEKLEGAHDALIDCRACGKVLRKLIDGGHIKLPELVNR